MDYFKYDAINYRDMLIWDNPIVINWDKQVVAREYISKHGGITKHTSVRSKPNQKWETVLTYENKGETLSKELLLNIQQLENKIKENELWSQLCLA